MRQVHVNNPVSMYLTDHAYHRICERLNMDHTKEETIDLLNMHSNVVHMYGRVMRVPGYNLDIRYTVLEVEKYVCTTVVAVFRPTYTSKMPKQKILHIKWVDANTLEAKYAIETTEQA